MPWNRVHDRLSGRRRLTRPLNLTRPVALRNCGNFHALVFCRVKAAQVSGKTLAGRMTIRFSHTPPNFWLGFLVAPFAGAAAAAVVTAVWTVTAMWGPEFEVSAAIIVSLLAGLVGLVISAAYTLVAGGFAVLYVQQLRKVPAKAVAVTIAILGGFAPFLAITLSQYVGVNVTFRLSEAVLIPTASLAASLCTALVFWRLALRGRQVPPANLAAQADVARSVPRLS
jgi:hypothetical protein